MNTNRLTILIGLLLLLSLTGFSQSEGDDENGSDPAVTSRDLAPAPLTGIGSAFSMTFTLGNNGTVDISGTDANRQMQFEICLTKCAPATSNPMDALSGSILTYFDVNWTGTCFVGTQRLGVAIGATELYNLVISAVVTQASSNTAVDDIGASCHIIPNASAGKQPTDNDYVSIYTHTTNTSMPVSLLSFTAQAQEDRTVLLNWSTSWERSNKGYVVERSKDLRNFEQVGEVKDVAGNSNSLTHYQLKDASPYLGTSYYRLKQTDQDGQVHVYPVVWVVVREQPYGVYPNPVRDNRLTLALDEPQTATVQLHTSFGQPVALQAKVMDEGHLELRSESKLPTGVYILRVAERGQTRQYRVVVSE